MNVVKTDLILPALNLFCQIYLDYLENKILCELLQIHHKRKLMILQ